MDEVRQLTAEFETLGEAAVADLLSHNAYKGEARAVALRWLNERSLSRIGIDVPIHEAHDVDPNLRRLARNEQVTRAAIICAVAALLASIGSLGLSVQTLQALQDIRHAAAAAAQNAAAQAQPQSPPKAPHS